MTLVTRYITKLEAIQRGIPRVATNAIVMNAELITEVLKERQLSKGLDASGAVVGKYKAWTIGFINNPKTPKHEKPRTNKNVGEPYNFEWYGELFDSLNIKVNAQNKSFDIYSVTGKDKFLETIYDTDLTTLMPTNERFVIETFVEPAIIDYINNEMAKL